MRARVGVRVRITDRVTYHHKRAGMFNGRVYVVQVRVRVGDGVGVRVRVRVKLRLGLA